MQKSNFPISIKQMLSSKSDAPQFYSQLALATQPGFRSSKFVFGVCIVFVTLVKREWNIAFDINERVPNIHHFWNGKCALNCIFNEFSFSEWLQNHFAVYSQRITHSLRQKSPHLWRRKQFVSDIQRFGIFAEAMHTKTSSWFLVTHFVTHTHPGGLREGLAHSKNYRLRRFRGRWIVFWSISYQLSWNFRTSSCEIILRSFACGILVEVAFESDHFYCWGCWQVTSETSPFLDQIISSDKW